MAIEPVIKETAEFDPREDMASAAAAAIPNTPGLRLARIGGSHLLVWLLALGLFAAADSWNTITGLALAGLFCVIAGAALGFITTNLVHEWFHYIGARSTRAAYTIPERVGLFVYDWDFDRNSLHQFFRMSIAGSIGGAVSIILLWNSVPMDTWGRAAVHGGALASFVFGAVIEWPVLRRTRVSGDPLAELSKIDMGVLTTATVSAAAAGLIWTLLVH